jgi:hypothetical protein
MCLAETLALAIISTVGLFFFWGPARFLVLALLAQGLIITPWLGPLVETGWAAALDRFGAFLSGAILALAFFSSAATFFERRPQERKSTTEPEPKKPHGAGPANCQNTHSQTFRQQTQTQAGRTTENASTKICFRLFLAFSASVWAAYTLVYAYGQGLLPPQLVAYIQTDTGTHLPRPVLEVLWVEGPALKIITTVGLLFFWRPARLLALALLMQGLIITPLLGPLVQTGWAGALDDFGAFLSGAVIALAFFSPVGILFERRPEERTPANPHRAGSAGCPTADQPVEGIGPN